MHRDEEALAVASAALESSEAESTRGAGVLASSLALHARASPAVDSIGVRLVPWGSVHAVQCTHGESVQTSCGLRLCSYDSKLSTSLWCKNLVRLGGRL